MSMAVEVCLDRTRSLDGTDCEKEYLGRPASLKGVDSDLYLFAGGGEAIGGNSCGAGGLSASI